MPVDKSYQKMNVLNKHDMNLRVYSYLKEGVLHEADPSAWAKAFSYVAGEKDRVFMGFELETFIEDKKVTKYVKETYKTPLKDYVNLRREFQADLEMVSVPATLEFHRKFVTENMSFDDLVIAEQNNGMHVHISKKNFANKEHLAKFYYLMNIKEMRGFINAIAGRDINKCRYCSPNKLRIVVDQDGILQGSYLKFEPGFVMKVDSDVHIGGKDGAINGAPSQTVEVRIFKAPDNAKRLIANLEFCHAMVEYTRIRNYQDLNLKRFTEILSLNKAYPELLNLKCLKEFFPKPKKAPVVKRKVDLFYGNHDAMFNYQNR